MGWANNIPNPFTVGGNGISGQIIVYNASNQIVGRIDETGIFVFSADLSDGSYVEMSPDINLEGTPLAGLGVWPKFGTFYGLSEVGAVFAETDLVGQPITTIAAPNVPTGGHAFIRLWSPQGTTAGLIELIAQPPLSGSNEASITVNSKVDIRGNTVGTQIDGNNNSSSVESTVSAAYVVKTADGLSGTFTKLHATTALKVTIHQTWLSSAINTTARFGVRLSKGGTDYDFDVCALHQNVANVHAQTSGTRVILPASLGGTGAYTVNILWKRTLGAGTLNTDTNDWHSICIEEVSDTNP